MGNADLRQLSVIHETDYESIAGSTVAVDAHNWLYKYLTTITRFTNTSEYTRSDGEELPNLIGVTRGMQRFITHNITPIFVFDGSAHELKSGEIKDRKQAKKKAEKYAENAETEIEKSKYESHAQRLTPEIIRTTKELLNCFDAMHFTAPQNAEAQASKLAQEGVVDYVVSDDYDTLLFGAPRTVRNFTSSSKPLEILDLEQTLEKHALTQDQLIDVGLLCGTDYNDGVHGIGVVTALKHMSDHGSLSTILTETGNTLDNADVLHNIFKSPNVTMTYPSLTTLDPDIDSIEALLKTNNISVESVQSALDTIESEASQTGLGNWT